MPYRSRRALLQTSLALLLAGCARPALPNIPRPFAAPTALLSTPLPATPTPIPEIEVEVERLLGSLSLEQQIGQIMVVAIRGREVLPHAIEMIHNRGVGGVILFTTNLGQPAHARALAAALQEQALAGSGIPLFTMLDQEGGVVVRAAEGVTVWPSQMLFGATRNPELVARAATMTAAELRAIGMNMNLAPVLDVNNNPDNPVIGTRSYGADPQLVAELGVRAITAYQQAGVIAAGKHFPGHGDTTIDSHLALPVIHKSSADLERLELIPFRAAIAAGVDALMTAHIALPEITVDQPATLSTMALTALLRKQLGYNGLIITDDLEMAAVVDRYGTAEAGLRAFKAGADLLLFRFREEEQKHGYALLLEAIRRDPALQEQLAGSVRRILRVKLQRGLFEPAQPALALVGSAEHRTAAIETAAAGITLVRNDAGLVPLVLEQSERIVVFAPAAAELEQVEVPIVNPIALSDAIAQHHNAVVSISCPLDPDTAARGQLVKNAGGAGIVVIGTYNLQRYPGQQAFVEELRATGTPVVMVSLRLPYDLLYAPQIETYLAAYDTRPPTMIALADILFGARTPAGRLPVPIGSLYPIGHGLS